MRAAQAPAEIHQRYEEVVEGINRRELRGIPISFSSSNISLMPSTCAFPFEVIVKARYLLGTCEVDILFRWKLGCDALDDIFQVTSEIRMNSVVPPLVPDHNPISRSFGADQCASSEGFLVTFTPEGTKVIFCGYSLISEYFLECLHFFDGRQSIQGRTRADHLTTNDSSQTYRKICSEFGTRFRQEWQYCRTRGDMALGVIPRERMRHNLMMTNPPRCILVASKPTDEGRIGTGRNTPN
jgi:hypothetical protein